MQKYGGISRYFANLHERINLTDGYESQLGVLFSNNSYIKQPSVAGAALSGMVKKVTRRYKYNKWYSRYLLRQNDFDVFHPTFYHPYFLKSLKKPFVLTVHDMINELFPEYFATDPFTGYKGRLIERADHIIAISESTKNDIRKFYDVDEKKISVIHLGYQMKSTQLSSNSVDVDDKYILFVGDRFGYKNFDMFIKAAAPVILKNAIKLVCAGGGGFKPDEIQLINDLKLPGRVSQLSVGDNLLMQLYQNAIAFVFPSLYEGFGLPVLEAFANNCPLILSTTPALREVGGDAAEYFDPSSAASIATAIENVINNKSLQQELRLKGKERVKLFDFGTTVQKTLQVYNLLA